MTKRLFVFVLLLGTIVFYQDIVLLAQTSNDYRCGNPDDDEFDDTLLEACLSEGPLEVELISGGYEGYVGYKIGGRIVDGVRDVTLGLHITRSGTRITSTGKEKARIFASRDFFGTILKTWSQGSWLSHFKIRNIIIDGMVDEMVGGELVDGEMIGEEPYRRRRHECDVGGDSGNVVLAGSSFFFEHNESINAMCGSGLGILGNNFFITNNVLSNNGRDKYSWYADGRRGFPWADGLTVLFCGGGYIAHNTLEDNTDIDLVIGGGRGCLVELNVIHHSKKYAFAGLNIGNYNNNGDHEGSIFRGNLIYSTLLEEPAERLPGSGEPPVLFGKLAMGILLGSHPWTPTIQVKNVGKVVGNTSYGNVINFLIDGVQGETDIEGIRGIVSGNTIYGPIGNDTNCGWQGVNYGVNPLHVEDMELQEGWVAYEYDQWSCNPLGLESSSMLPSTLPVLPKSSAMDIDIFFRP